MSKKYKATVAYLMSQDKATQERIDFAKTQGKFFSKVIDPLEKHRDACNFFLISSKNLL
jgi:hypothetical protein